jgi:hypothetical protein
MSELREKILASAEAPELDEFTDQGPLFDCLTGPGMAIGDILAVAAAAATKFVQWTKDALTGARQEEDWLRRERLLQARKNCISADRARLNASGV